MAPPRGWASCARRRPTARVRLYCFPYAGGGLAAYQPWAARLPDPVEVWTVCLPGREHRLDEAARTDLTGLVDELRAALAPQLAGPPAPVAFFGHSLGALLAYELARDLRAHGEREPAALVLSGRAAAHHPPRRRMHTLDDDAFVAAVRSLGGAPSAALEHPELRELCLPTLRADITAAETYRHRPGPPLDCAITSWAGDADEGVPPDAVAEWARHTRGPTRHRRFPGGHFFPWSAPGVLAALAEDIGLQGRAPC
ncbi:thioesterase II family protein [Micromonospora haikouensis]|uniref:thioesterase II family protein n=1 Tax=Micromonospora haikouensis TaxID=686309 RepID=UPI00367466CC